MIKKIGILGAGMMSQVGHIPFYYKNPSCEIVAIYETRKSIIDGLKIKYKEINIIENLDEFINEYIFDGVVISVPRLTTYNITRKVLASKTNVIVEKPMSHTLEDAIKLNNIALKNKLIYSIGYMKRYDPGIIFAKKLFDKINNEKMYGKLLFSRFYNFSNAYAVNPPEHIRPRESRSDRYEESRSSPEWLPTSYIDKYLWFMNSASHDINLINYFFPSENKIVNKVEINQNIAISASIECNEVLIDLNVTNTKSGVWLEGFHFLYERGSIFVEIPSPMDYNKISKILINDGISNESFSPEISDQEWSFSKQANSFIDNLFGFSKPLTDGSSGCLDIELCEKIWAKFFQIIN